MPVRFSLPLVCALALGACSTSAPPVPTASSPPSATVETTAGPIEGMVEDDGLRVFRGVPFAAPPVGDLRWAPPQPPEPWTEVREATAFGAKCVQANVFGDMAPRAEGMSEDCLTLNVWTPAASASEALPVLVYFYGGGFVAGDASEPRYDGAAIAREGTVVVVPNYRLGVFGFLAHPELSEASGYGASGNYGLMDQTAALAWVRDNVAAFGGDPDQVTIAGESAGSISVSAQMVAPAARGLFHRAIGESGSALGALPPVPLADAEAAGVRFAGAVGAASLADLRAVSAEDLLDAASQMAWFSATLDGRVYPEPPVETYAAGRQAQVPLLLGWNSEEMSWRALFGGREPTPEAYAEIVRFLYPDDADEVLALYPGETEEQVIASATDLAGDRFIGLSTWTWYDLHRQTGGAPVYRYYYAHPRPPLKGGGASGLAGGVVEGAEAPPPATGAVHSAEIEYALGNLDTHPVYAWTADDYAVSETMMGYFVRFIHTGDPNGPGLPEWPAASAAPGSTSAVMVIDVESGAIPAPHRARYELLDRLAREVSAAE